MNSTITFLGGTREIGASSSYLYFGGTGIIIDSGLHPCKRDKTAFPCYPAVEERQADFFLLTHAHTDHLGALPYLLKFFPYIRLIATPAARDLSEIMLKDAAKLMKSELAAQFSEQALSLYSQEILDRIWMLMETVEYEKELKFETFGGDAPVKVQFFHSGHILGSASIYAEYKGKCFLHTGDVQFADQAVIAKAKLPRHHLDTLVIEATNGGETSLPETKAEKKRLARFINNIVNQNGSILIPSFALGKTQEVLTIIYKLILAGKIPKLPIYTGGMGGKISKIYDRYCYSVPMVKPGFEISDIEQIEIDMKRLMTGPYFKEPSIVVVPSGMMNRRTISYRLALKWMKIPGFGIAFAGYQDPDNPGAALLKSNKDELFTFGSEKSVRKCEVEKFRFSSHASPEQSISYIMQTKPKRVFIVHGDEAACEKLALNVRSLLPQCRVIVPESLIEYDIF